VIELVDFSSLKPGVRLNKLIAEHVMGWLKRPDGSLWNPGYRQDAPVYVIPEYSLDISDAWIMEEKIANLRLMMPYTEALKSLCRAYPGDTPMTFDLVHAAPFLRCLAALEAVRYRKAVEKIR
jgi:hypothetical protein